VLVPGPVTLPALELIDAASEHGFCLSASVMWNDLSSELKNGDITSVESNSDCFRSWHFDRVYS